MNRALHSIAAHLHRYNSELEGMQDTLEDVLKHHGLFEESKGGPKGIPAESADGRVSNGLGQIASHLKQVRAFLRELETKLQNILALVSLIRNVRHCQFSVS